MVGADHFTYLARTLKLIPADYEVMVTLGSNSGFQSIIWQQAAARRWCLVWLSSFIAALRVAISAAICTASRNSTKSALAAASTSITMNQTVDAVWRLE